MPQDGHVSSGDLPGKLVTNCQRDGSVPFPHGRLRERIREVSQRALVSGNLKPMATYGARCTDGGADFAIRVLEGLERKPRRVPADPSAHESRNPFLPYEQDLYVADITDDYVGVLNKYKVVDDHLLLITRDFVPQTDPLGIADFEALAICLSEFDSLGFYNSGMVAGASQPHRHLQLVPLPLDPDGTIVPFWSAMQVDRLPEDVPSHAVGLPFRHELVRFKPRPPGDTIALAECLYQAYNACSHNCWQSLSASTPYNFLATRDWFLFVPRRQECFVGISLNAMAYVGGLLVSDRQQLDELIQRGCMRALCETAGTVQEDAVNLSK